jgi:hypothetical protein
MNPDTNKFEPLSEGVRKLVEKLDYANPERAVYPDIIRPNGEPVPKHWTVLTVGQDVVVENYTFTVAHIGESHLLLEPKGSVVIGKDK